VPALGRRRNETAECSPLLMALDAVNYSAAGEPTLSVTLIDPLNCCYTISARREDGNRRSTEAIFILALRRKGHSEGN